ncbi:hypothetical protein SODALDRAFT_34033 [Sodiomyces alkalinus F11]|uniref:N-acetyltransferase domain-containing protein n=1 Tax=Sodiomyces alkalinus (strain CBS 110278 / VKM F-3762 / F11) TaxID=1314773 RepID=A0A3N2Q923_SODAK|nr:hypothetical protein SODALDRAFT_34033 [Sodiomyces alkalinus F11]ROT43226.1 hypothetical protein SODALDRAFT_34033 [Sodiomyces alkalinus F11]
MATAVLLWDRQESIPLQRLLSPDDLIILLTPVVVPSAHQPAESRDPFEPLGRAIALHHPLVRHVPYTKRGGITGTHAAFIKRGKVIVFVISGPPGDNEPSQADYAEIAASVGGDRPQVILACCDVRAYDLGRLYRFATIIQIAGFTPPELEKAAEIMFGTGPGVGTLPQSATRMPELSVAPRSWTVETWDLNRDLAATHELWTECLPRRFHLPQGVLGSLLRREGYAMHYAVRDPDTRQLLGFCATYTTYPDSSSDRLVGSLAVLLVREGYRGRGIGESLHEMALKQLQRTRGVDRLQLGSTFPRLLYGVPSDMTASEDWFRRRGWEMDQRSPRRPPGISDWLLSFDEVPGKELSTAGLTFRPCPVTHFSQVLEAVDRDSIRKGNVGWYDQYAKLGNTMHLEDVILGLEGDIIVSVAIVYTPTSGSPILDDLPWARTLGSDVGGVTCVCIVDNNPEVVNSRDSIMVRLLDTCIKLLSHKGMKRMFLDGVRGGDEGFQSLGFRRWSRYKESWRRV